MLLLLGSHIVLYNTFFIVKAEINFRLGGDVSVRFIMVVSVPTEAGNQLMKDPSGVKTLEDYLNTIKPEAAYFSELYGERTFFIVLDLPTPDAIPTVAEPLFKLGARVGFHP
jgi:hypothetical protein